MSLGSLTFASCHMLCEQAAPVAGITFDKCWAYMQQQRQVRLASPSQHPHYYYFTRPTHPHASSASCTPGVHVYWH